MAETTEGENLLKILVPAPGPHRAVSSVCSAPPGRAPRKEQYIMIELPFLPRVGEIIRSINPPCNGSNPHTD